MKLITLLSFITLLFATAQAQVNWQEIETDIRKKKNLIDLSSQLEQIKNNALQKEEYGMAGRCYNYLLQIADSKTEDSLYFKNSFFTDSIVRSPNSPLLLKSIMHIIKAKRIAGYSYRFFNRNNKNLIKGYNTEYYLMTQAALDSLTQTHFEKAKSISLQLTNTKTEELLWLSSDPLLFFFKPQYTDIIYGEQIHVLQLNQNSNQNTRSAEWLKLTPDAFLNDTNNENYIPANLQPAYKLFRQWAVFNTNNPSAYYFIETVSRKYLYNRINLNTEVKKLYEDYLQKLLASSHGTVKAHAVYQLCLYWNSEASKYNSITHGDDYYRITNWEKPFDTTFRFHYTKALQLYNQNEKLLDSFSFVNNILVSMKEKILLSQVSIETMQTQLPDDSIAVFLKFKNVAAVYIRAVKIDALYTFSNKEEYNISYLKSLPAITTQVISLPVTTDNQMHSVHIKLNSLPDGHYALLYSDAAITKDGKTTDYIIINVTNIAVINNDERVFVLNRTTGFALPNTTVQLKYKNKSILSVPKKVNTQGWVIIKENNVDRLIVVSGKDTTVETINDTENDLPDEVYNKEDGDDLLDYYDDKIKLYMFTDRAIYRPGQTMQYKGIFLTRNPWTGEPVVLNKKNLKFPWLQKIFNSEVKEMMREKKEIYLKDAFDRIVDTIKVSANEYGSFAGSYIIKKDAAAGDWEFDPEYIDLDYNNSGRFKVEEYKRPSFEVALEKPTNYLQLGDSFSVKVKVKSFAGASLNNVKIKYKVSFNGDIPSKDSLTSKPGTQYFNKTILDSAAFTNNNGELEINISSAFLKKYEFNNDKFWAGYYTINAEAIDATGESHEENLKINLGTRPVKINYSLPKIIEHSQFPQVFISAKNDYAGELKKELSINLYKYNKKENSIQKKILQNADYSLENNAWNYTVYFEAEKIEEDKPVLIYSAKLTTGGSNKFSFPQVLLQSGFYKMEVICKEGGKITGENIKEFSVFDKGANTLPEATTSFHFLPVNSAAIGETVKWISGNTVSNVYSIYHVQYFSQYKKNTRIKYDYSVKAEQKGINEWSYRMPQDAIDEITITHIYILNNELYKESKQIYINKTAATEPEIIIEQYRKKLTPGGKETFMVSIKTKNENTAAELMTTMYDASLDKIENHEWQLPRNNQRFYIRSEWPNNINSKTNNSLFADYKDGYHYPAFGKNTEPLWWLNPLDYAYDENKFTSMPGMYQDGIPGAGAMLMGKVAGVNIVSTEGLNEIIVTGYSTVSQKRLTSSVSSTVIRGISSIGSYNIPFVILDGVPYEGDLSKINTSLITDGIILKGADATAIYGSKAANGVLVLSTKGPVQLPKPEEPPVVVRKNFSETAFFFPQVHADNDGYYNINFTMPESVTEWKWKLLAHTKNAKFIVTERSIFTQLPMMVQPNIPRFLYQGDKIILQTRITNLDSTNLSGTINCIIEDAVTGEDITSAIITNKQQLFSVKQKSNSNASYTFNIPNNLLHPLKIKISAKAGSFSDGEEHIIPILSKKILVSQNVPFVLFNKKDTSIATPVLPSDAEAYGIGIYITTKPQAAMINALPYLAFYPHNCAEQTFNKILAYATAAKILRTDTAAQKTMQSVIPQQENNSHQALPDELSEHTMPWLQLNHATAVHQKKLLQLFDTLAGNQQIEKYITELKDLQNIDGGITWFKGGKSSKYISNYILAGFGKLQKDKLPFTVNSNVQNKFISLLPSLINYCDAAFADTFNYYYGNTLFYLYARAYWLKDYPLSDNITAIGEIVLTKAWKNADSYSLNGQASLITASLLYKDKYPQFNKVAIKQLESIRQLAIADKINGVRWKDISNSDDLNNSGEETIVNIAKAFEEIGDTKETVNGIIKWLLNAKQEHNWSTTKSTAEVAGLLQRHQSFVTGVPAQFSASINNVFLTVTDNLLKGDLYSFTPLQQFAATAIAKKDNEAVATGGFNYYYFTANPPVAVNSNGVKISKRIYFYNTANNQWEAVNENSILKIADKLKTIITIDAPRQLKYVFIDEKRSAAGEPKDARSGYEYSKGFSYYKTVKDAGYQFFAEEIPSGISSIEYETVISATGIFSNGPVALQCMYQPQVRAYGTGIILKVK
jgi:alpha-2-macroglobulin